MNHLNIDTDATVVWDGAASFPVDTRNHLYVSFDVIALADVPAGTVVTFEVEHAAPDSNDPCIPGDFGPIPEVVVCSGPAEPADVSEFTITGPVAEGQRCKFTIPCPSGFLQVVGEADFQVIALTWGRKR